MVVVEAVVDRGRDPPQEPPPRPGQKVGHLGLAVIGMARGEKAGEAEQTAPQELPPERGRPVRVAPVDPPGHLDERPKAPVPQWGLLDEEFQVDPFVPSGEEEMIRARNPSMRARASRFSQP